MDESKITELFCLVYDFCNRFKQMCKQQAVEYKKKKIRQRESRTALCEVMTILLLFHQSNYRTFKHFYLKHVQVNFKHLFPNLVSYPRFVQLISEAFFPLFCFAQEHRGIASGINFVDSSVLTTCHVRRASSHRTFKGMAKWGKTSTGWFFGFKLHLVINHQAEIVAFRLTSANTDDREPVPGMVKNMRGKLYGDRGYISEKLRKILIKNGILLITRIKKNMKNKLMALSDKFMLRKRALIESVLNLLKTHCQIEHHRHRSKYNFLSNLLSGLAAYCLREDKPRLFFPKQELEFFQSM